MKKIMIIAATLTLMLNFAACGKKDENPNTSTPETTVQTTTETIEESPSATTETTGGTTFPDSASGNPESVLDAIWNAYEDDQKFPAFGGDATDELVEEPAGVKLDANTLDNTYGFPGESIEKIDAAASLMHMMNANTFTCGAYSVKDGEDIEALANEIRDNILARQWICGFPDSLLIMTVDNTIISVFGNAFAVEPFRDTAKSVHQNLTIVFDEPIE